MTEKKLNFNARQSLQFSAQTPNFLKMLQSGGSGRQAHPDPIPNDDSGQEDGDGDAGGRDRDDEAPQIVLGTGVSGGEAERFLGKTGAGTDAGTAKRGAGEDVDGGEAEAEEEEEGTADGKPRFKKRRKTAGPTGGGKGATTGGTAAVGDEKRALAKQKKRSAMKHVKSVKDRRVLSFGDDE
ncbi:uncharacterized protein EV422DRAFT_69494 [Fimicolochytrium jonesii]|uniref:uncharacterized protein n=1 Tax=Fimicolochytrium jonesii TaxID=1396493 RepID=UPI0022FE6DE9|nr:uncharacterized protein EV422DRAFT_69494 [Fimicolochytrium jonesii]KAI8820409.1 hypothetical protein EV422DRAFT_69494 [Fimicolochytrium jonesii]